MEPTRALVTAAIEVEPRRTLVVMAVAPTTIGPTQTGAVVFEML